MTEIISNKGTNGEPLTDTNGDPIEGARIIAYHTGGNFASDGDIFITTTDSNGEYAFTDTDLPETYISGETAQTDYLHIFAEIGSASSPRRAIPIRPWQGYSLAKDGLIENFEEGIYENNNNTLSDIYAGDLSQYSRQQATVLEGSYSLEGITTSGDFFSIASTTGLPEYFDTGQTARVKLQLNSGANSGTGANFIKWCWFAQSEQALPNAYEAGITGEGNLVVEKRSSSGLTDLASENIGFSNNTLYELEVEHTADGNGTHNIRLYDVNNNPLGNGLSFSDREFTDGGIAWLINSTGIDTEAYMDDVRITG